MRLVCPNCEAKYEVPEDAIPETGRDVQCANCGHAWYQMRPRAAPAGTASAPLAPTPAPASEPVAEARTAIEPAIAEPAADGLISAPDAVPEPAEPETEQAVVEETPTEVAADVSEPVVAESETIAEVVDAVPEVLPSSEADLASAKTGAAEAVVEAAASASDEVIEAAETVVDAVGDPVLETGLNSEPVAVEETMAEAAAAGEVVAADDLGDPVADASVSPVAAEAAAYAVDESVLAILREEAEREAQARRAEAAKPLETQTDLGIESAIPAAKKLYSVAGQATEEPGGDDKLANRRTRLPNVEEINSTLRPAESVPDGDGPAETMPMVVEGRSSFRTGFLLVLTVAILGSALYGSADALADAVPSLAGPLKAYVSFVDSLRLQLDGLMQSATVAINGN